MDKPNLFIVGAPKAGTTFLYDKLSKHPNVYTPDIKELNYFTYPELTKYSYYKDFKIDKLEKYLDFFEKHLDQKYLVDSSVSYFAFENTARKIADFNTEAKIVITLRDPVKRAFSHYLMDRRMGYADKSFIEYIKNNSKHPFHYFQYIGNSQYTKNIRRYLDTFGRENVFLLKLENLDNHLPCLFDFLGVEDMSLRIETNEKINSKKTSRNKIGKLFLKNRHITQRLKLWLPDKFIELGKLLLYENSSAESMSKEEEKAAKRILNEELKAYYN